MEALCRFILRRAGLVVALATLLTAPAFYYTAKLYQNLRTDLEELLPTTARSVIDLGEVTHRLQSIDNIAILIFSKNGKATRRFVDDLVVRLEQLPETVSAGVEYKIQKELEFFRKRRALYVELDDLIHIRDFIRERIDYEKQLYNPLNIFAERELKEPVLDVPALMNKYAAKTSSYDRFPDGYYATPDETKRVILVNLSGKGSGIGTMLALKRAVEAEVSALHPKSYADDIEIKYSGGVQNTIEEHEALIEDLGLSTLIVLVLTMIAMLAFFRSIRGTFALLASLLMGTLWCFGVSYFAVGYLNANSAFLGSIIIGNGINFGIILLARYFEERRKQRGHVRATYEAMVHTATATWTAALAAGLSYGSLMLTGFRGFNQFGVIGLIGMVLCWISAFTVLPALLTLLERLRPLITPSRKKPKQVITTKVASLVKAYPKLIWATAFVITLASLATFVRLSPDVIETNLSKLRNKKSMTEGSGYLSKYVDEIFQRYLSPMVILPRKAEDTEAIAAAVRAAKSKEGSHSLIHSVQTMADFVPKQQLEKHLLLKQIQRELTPRVMARLSPEKKKFALEFLTPEVFEPVTRESLPALIRTKFTEKDGSVGKLVLVEPPLSSDTWNRDKLIQFIHDLRYAADSVTPGTAVAGGLAITSDMVEAVTRDGPRATLFAFLSVILLVITLFRHPKTISLILFALTLGVIWLFGIILGFGLKINFLNFIALPITFGIGVDYGVNIFQRYREEGGGNIVDVIRQTGGAVALCSLTTTIGYGSLLIAGNQAFVSFGLLSVLGEITCLLAAVVALPAFLLTRLELKR